MKTMNRHAAFFLVFILTLGVGCLAAGCASSDDGSSDTAADTTAKSNDTDDAVPADTAEKSSGTADIEAAEALIGQEMTMDEVEAKLGAAKDFSMSAEGCERGVMQGIFYYDDFTVFSRTYDKGGTFTIVSVSD